MPSHKKNPVFIRIISHDGVVECINPLQVSNFQIVEKAKIKIKSKDAKEGVEIVEADTIRFYFPSGTGRSFSVGIDITQNEFDCICSTLLEYLYLNEQEFLAKTAAIEKSKMSEWNKISQENSKALDTAKEA